MDKQYDYKSDIWSLGCVLYEIAALHPPFKASNMKSLYKKVVTSNYPPLQNRYSKDLCQVIEKMLMSNP